MQIRSSNSKTTFTDLSSAECRSKAEANLALADRGGTGREQRLVDAEGWMLLADHLDYVETALASDRLRRLN
jgi:hypothetical protein